MKSAAMGVIDPSPVRGSTCIWLIPNWLGRLTRFMSSNGSAWNLFFESDRRGRRQKMPTTNAPIHAHPKKALGFHLSIEPSTYPDRSPVLSQEERQEMAYLLTLPP